MLARVLNLRKIVVPILLCTFVAGMTSCATQKQTALVNDPDDHHDSMIPWNKQEQWETTGQFAGLTDRR